MASWIQSDKDVKVEKLLDDLARLREQNEGRLKEVRECGDRLSSASDAESAAQMRLDAVMSDGLEPRAELMTKIVEMARAVDASATPEYQFRLAGTDELLKLATLAVAREKELAQGIEAARASLSEARARHRSAKAEYERVSAANRVVIDTIRAKEEEIARICADA